MKFSSSVAGSLISAGLWVAVGCGGAGPDGADDSPATLFDLPTVPSSGGPVLAAPRVQAIYLPGHQFAAEIDDFLARFAASAYWPAVVAEYGVGGMTVLPSHTSSTAGPATIGVGDVSALFAQVMAADAAALGPPNPDTAYMLLLPASTVVTMSGQALCQDGTASGYHTETAVNGTRVALIVIPFCTSNPGDSSLTGVSVFTPTISHELVEASTDPFPSTAPAFLTVDDKHAIWAVADNGGELADLCENETPNSITPGDIGLPVSRIWSNAAVAAGTAPCVPTLPGETYFIAIPRQPDSVTVQRDGKSFSVPAVRAAVGASVTVQVTLHSLGAVTTWGVGALEYHASGRVPDAAIPRFGRDRQTLTINVDTNATEAGLFPLVVVSGNGTDSHFWFGTMFRQ